jgi:protease-4
MQKSFLRETATAVMKATVFVVTVVLVITTLTAMYEVETGISDGRCNIAVLPIEGVILPYHGLGDFEMIITPETVESFMDTVEDDDVIKAVLLEINSPGGTPVASERIAERFRSSGLPIVGLIGDVGASGGYMIAAASDYLIASPMSDVGSIGVNMSYVEESAKNKEDGLTYVQLTTGKFKDIGSPNRPITEEERELLQADLDLVHNEFINIVTEYRDLDRDKVVALANGASMPGVRALDVELIDELGGREEATNALSKILEIDADDIKYCEYDKGFVLF